MHEVINLSCSQRSGHLLTHLYNEQELHIPYSKTAQLTHSNEVFLWPIRSQGKSNYYPRSINFEFDGGFGFLSKYEYHEPKVDLSKLEIAPQSTSARIDKNEFQQKLDAGATTDRSLLNLENTKFWTDYNKLIYRPSLLVELENYQHPLGTHRHFQKSTFKDYQYGEPELKLVYDAAEDTFRKQLEGLDNIQGINFFTEVDNGWGGFTNELIVQLKDEYFNNGVNSKYNLWCYGLLSAQENVLTRIKSVVELSKSSTLFFPILPVGQNLFLNQNFNAASLWHQSAVQSLFVNSIWDLNCQNESPVRMAEIEANVHQGFSKRNIVNEISLVEQKKAELGFGIVQDVDINMYLAGTPETPTAILDDRLDLGFTSGGTRIIGRKSVISTEQLDEDANIYVSSTMDHVTKLDTFPDILDKKYRVEFGQTGEFKETLKNYQNIIKRVRLPAHLDIIGDRSELIEDISVLIEEYTTGYESESDWDE